APSTQYQFYVIARDAAGNSSPPSGAVTFTTTSGGTGGGCSAAYKVTNSWQGNFQGEVTVQNTGTKATAGWTVKWTFPNGQKITTMWNGTYTQSGGDVTVKNAGYNGTLQPGASALLGFQATWTGTNGLPTGVTCTAS
ncbi:cellulose binding domain-containing protein, partial [Sphaerisporangium rufum]|uniref:cellulose binding domain-containing protein n=1 Tax=Sphaerisporangium rufum TaxID=1381558 RepID=UPI001950CBE6